MINSQDSKFEISRCAERNSQTYRSSKLPKFDTTRHKQCSFLHFISFLQLLIHYWYRASKRQYDTETILFQSKAQTLVQLEILNLGQDILCWKNGTWKQT